MSSTKINIFYHTLGCGRSVASKFPQTTPGPYEGHFMKISKSTNLFETKSIGFLIEKQAIFI